MIGTAWSDEGMLVALRAGDETAFRMLVKRAQSRGVRERRTMPFSSLAGDDGEQPPTVDPDRFLPSEHAAAGYWSLSPNRAGDRVIPVVLLEP